MCTAVEMIQTGKILNFHFLSKETMQMVQYHLNLKNVTLVMFSSPNITLRYNKSTFKL